MFKLEQFLTPEVAEKLRGGNMHKIASVMEANKGNDIGPELNLPEAVFSLGKMAYEKKATMHRMNMGIQAAVDALKDAEV